MVGPLVGTQPRSKLGKSRLYFGFNHLESMQLLKIRRDQVYHSLMVLGRKLNLHTSHDACTGMEIARFKI